jgi:hypothetical protein
VGIDGARGHARFVAPDFAEKLVAGDDAAAVIDEVFEQLIFAHGEWDGLAGATDFGLAGVEFDIAEGEKFLCAAGGAGAAEQRFDAGEQFHHVERLGDIVVGSFLEADDFVDDLASGGEHEDGNGVAGLANPAADLEAGFPG